MKICSLGSLPPVGEVPEYMYAQVLRQERYGHPINALKIEEVPVPPVLDNEVLVAVKSAGLNYNSVWACTGYPMDMIKIMQMRKESNTDFQVLGSDCAGVVYKVGGKVKNVKVGDEVVVQAGWYDPEDPWIKKGGDPSFSLTARAWGYETSWGSFAQFCKVKDFQCVPKPSVLNWNEAAVYMLCGATVYRMLFKYPPHTVKKGDVVLIWGAAGGLGSMAIQLVKMAGGIPIGVVNSQEKMDYVEGLGAKVINRNDFDHWGALKSDDLLPETQEIWRSKAKVFMKKILELSGGKLPRIVLEHPGEFTMPTSLFVCDREGMVVTCAGTTGYLASFDVRYLWLQRKRIQGSHFANPDECVEFNNLVMQNKVQPALSHTFAFEDLPFALQTMYENKSLGNIAIKISL